MTRHQAISLGAFTVAYVAGITLVIFEMRRESKEMGVDLIRHKDDLFLNLVALLMVILLWPIFMVGDAILTSRRRK